MVVSAGNKLARIEEIEAGLVHKRHRCLMCLRARPLVLDITNAAVSIYSDMDYEVS